MLIDVHTHLDKYDDELENALDQVQQAGIFLLLGFYLTMVVTKKKL